MGGEQSSLAGITLRRTASLGRNRGNSETPSKASNRPFTAPDSTFRERSSSLTKESTSTRNDASITFDIKNDHHVESFDIQGVEWEGYVEKKGHLVRNWKLRFFTLEKNVLSYYEAKEDARRRTALKGRVTITEVKLDNRVKSAHGHDFVFETEEGKHFHLSAATDLDRRVWVHMIEAGIDFASIERTNRPIYGNHQFQKTQHLDAEGLYSLYRRVLTTEPELIPEFLFYFSKDVVLSLYYPRKMPFHGDFFGREGLLYFLSTLRESAEMIEFSMTHFKMAESGSSALIKGVEKLKSKVNSTVIIQPWVHHVRFGPYGRIVKLKMEIDPKQATGNWLSFGAVNPYADVAVTGMRSTRSLGISLHDFSVHHVIGKGGFGTVVNARKKSDGQIYALKILEKGKMTKYDIDSSFTEMMVAQKIHHPFIAGLRLAFQSRTKLFLGMNYYAGGDLFHHMSKGATCRIAPARARFYTAELILGIHHLHQHDILYRDIKPENVMIDISGHIALVDFGLAKLHVSNHKGAKTMAGSPQYTAPELLLPKGKRSYGKSADWWSLGILLYEMTIGKSPFFDNNVEKMYKKILNEAVGFPQRPSTSDHLKDLITGLLRKDQRERYGNNITDLLEHPFFEGIDWDLLLQKKIEPPWKPKLQSELDVGYVDSEFTELDASREVSSPNQRIDRSKSFLSQLGVKSSKKSSPMAQDPTFKDFNYFCEDPDSLVQVNTLCGELRPTIEIPDAVQPLSEVPTVRSPMPMGTPLSSFVENGRLDYPSPENHNGILSINDLPSITDVCNSLETTSLAEEK